ncbi:MAG: LLM class F420-dependent oxidoreductase [Rhodospirillaceae bacterium]|jgi:probable F420-dependent oxidoreductase|nr:LLM class F420-dependent oxidoreductase [Rhodospirillaceae bacterium]MBT5664355.1 LLM class F420-dependent oxidoreductase [Rhodospirillaceae bacterium]MBT5810538.1 LLM class F420-dependent oxidoreductase [Rhodospirillaceae bacterium]
MDFGFAVPTRGPLAAPEDICRIASHGESLGYAHVYVNDHVVVPGDIASRYPYTQAGDWPGAPIGEAMEVLALLSYLAHATTTARLLTSVMVVPYRNPMVTAKMLSTIDVLSHGRVTVGCGVGWMREEFEAIGTPPFEARGRVVDEYLSIFKELWTQDTPAYDGEFSQFSNVSFLPKPVQKPHPPLWIGGESPAALRRAARLGDAWYPVGNNPRHPLDTVEAYAAGAARMKTALDAEGRDGSDFTLAFITNMFVAPGDGKAQDGGRMIFTGSDDNIRSDIQALSDLGVKHLMVNLQTGSMDETLDNMSRFASDIMPAGGN